MKRIVSVVLIAVMCLAIIPQTAAARDVSNEEILAQNLKSLGIFRGVSDTEFDLGRAPTRVEALVMLIRLLGKEAEALDGSYDHPFVDVPQWADGYVGYAYENGLTNGMSATLFGTTDANIQMYLAFTLRALGYSEKTNDFSYENPYTLASHAGILPSSVSKERFLRADCVIISYASLSAYLKNSDKTLAQKLIGEGVFTENDFEKYYDKTALNYSTSSQKELSAEEIYTMCSPAVFYIEVYDAHGDLYGTGSGFFIESDGTAVTNYHVIDGMYSAKAVLSDTQEEFAITGVYDHDVKNDWAVIKVDGSGFKTLDIGEKSSIVGGATVYAIGSPMGLQNTISQGLISNTNRLLDGVNYIQTTAAISHGSSGGAFINKYGQVIGITSAGFTEGENLGLAIPVYAIEGYDKSTLTPLRVLAGGGIAPEYPGGNNTPVGQLSAAETLRAFVLEYKNETIDNSIAYTFTKETNHGYIDCSIVLDEYNEVYVLVWEVYEGDTYWFSLDLTGESTGYVFYAYGDAYDYYEFKGSKYFTPQEIKRGTYVAFDKTEGNIKKDTEEAIATEYLETALDYVNIVYEVIEPGYTVADLGFVNFR